MRPVHESPAALPSSEDSGPGRPREPGGGTGFDQLREHAAEAVALLRRQRRLFLCVTGATTALLALAILLQTPLYESTALLLVKFGRELVYQPEVGAEEQVFAPRDKQSVINSELAILRSQPVLKAVVRDVGVATLYPGLAEAVPEGGGGEAATQGGAAAESAERSRVLQVAEAAERLRLGLSAQALPEAEVLQISFRHPDPLVAAETVNAVVERFLEAHLSAFSEPKIAAFLEQRVEQYEERLAESERRLRDFETEHPAFALETPQQMLLQFRDEQRAELREIESQMASIRLRHLQEDDSVNQARNNLLTLQVEASGLRGEARREIASQIAVVERFIESRRNEMSDELERLESQLAPLRAALAETERELANLPKLSAEYRRLRRDRDGDEEQYRTYRRRLRDARLSGEMDRENIASINVIQPGSPSAQPVWPPSKGASLGIAVVLALIAGGLVAIAVDRMGPTGIAWLDGDRRSREDG